MPGICGVADATTRELASDVERMVQSLCHHPWQTAGTVALPSAGFGQVMVSPPGQERTAVFGRWRDLTVAFDGEIYDVSGLSPGSTLADRVARTLDDHGPSALDDVHGCYACAVWDANRNELVLLTDPFGMRPVYWTRHGRGFAFASEIKGLQALPGVARDLSEDGLAQFLAFGQYLGQTTLYHDIEVVPAASRLTFSLASGDVRFEARERSDESFAVTSDAQWLELIDERLKAAVDQSCNGGGALGLSLSGGLDARTILAVAPEGCRLECVSLGIPGSLDHRAAAQLAAMAGQPHRPQMLAGDFLARFDALLEQMVRLTDGQYLDQGIVLTTLAAYRELGVQTLLRGHAGELMHLSKAYAFSLDDEGAHLSSKAALTDWLWRHLTGYMIGDVDEAFFSSAVGGRLRDRARAALEKQLAEWDFVEPVPQRIWRLFVYERLRRETALSLQLFRNFVEVRVPFLEPRLVSALLSAPTHLKIGDTIQSFVLQRRRPSFMRVVNANTGARLGASAAVIRASHFKLRVLAKLGVPGYQPYERLGSWLAHELQPWLRRVLLTNHDGALAPAEWEHLIAQHASRQRNHTFLLMAGAILSLQLQRDRSPDSGDNRR